MIEEYRLMPPRGKCSHLCLKRCPPSSTLQKRLIWYNNKLYKGKRPSAREIIYPSPMEPGKKCTYHCNRNCCGISQRNTNEKTIEAWRKFITKYAQFPDDFIPKEKNRSRSRSISRSRNRSISIDRLEPEEFWVLPRRSRDINRRAKLAKEKLIKETLD